MSSSEYFGGVLLSELVLIGYVVSSDGYESNSSSDHGDGPSTEYGLPGGVSGPLPLDSVVYSPEQPLNASIERYLRERGGSRGARFG
jgi:hypothetical protein